MIIIRIIIISISIISIIIILYIYLIYPRSSNSDHNPEAQNDHENNWAQGPQNAQLATPLVFPFKTDHFWLPFLSGLAAWQGGWAGGWGVAPGSCL